MRRMKRTAAFFMILATVWGSSNLFGSSIISAMAGGSTPPAPERYFTSIEIQPGDSLWSIAARYSDGGDLSLIDYVAELRRMNGLHQDTIHAGQYLTVLYFAPGE